MNKNVLLFIGIVLAMSSEISAVESFATEIPRQKLVFTTPEQEGLFTKYLHEIFRELGKRTGVECALKELPKKVCLISADSGLYDGVAARIKGIETEHLNLRMIEVSHFTVQHILFAKNQDIVDTIHNDNDLTRLVKKTNRIVGFLRGSKKALKLLTGLPNKNIFPLDSPEKGFELLSKGRINFYLAGPGMVNRAIFKKKFHNSGIKEVCVLSETQLFPYLHIKHSAIMPIFEKELQTMVNDGTISRIRKVID